MAALHPVRPKTSNDAVHPPELKVNAIVIQK